MSMPERQPAAPVILPATFTATNPLETFVDPHRGDVAWHTLFSQPSTPTKDLTAGVAICPPRTGHLRLHRHPQAEIYYILEGRGTVVIHGEEHAVEKGCAVFIPGDAEHGMVNDTENELKWLFVFPTQAFTDVQYRFSHEMRKAS